MSLSRQVVFTLLAGAMVAGVASVASAQVPVRVGGIVREPVKIHHVDPVYPEIAKQAKVQGIVIVEVTIDTDGSVIDARVLRPVPLLDQAALDAVRQWKYTPTLVNGEPTQLLMVVTVNFTLKTGGPIRVGGAVTEPKRITYVDPVYPEAAKAAGIQGMVIIEVLIDKDGSVIGTKVLRSVPELDAAAVDAVKQWKYEPTIVNGEPQQLVMTITVNFTLK